MCGIAVILGDSAEPAFGRKALMLDRLSHRGPDGRGGHEIGLAGDRRLWLGHTRLSILDLTDAARQPMIDPAGGDAIVYNGEIYNYRELARELAGHGHRLRSTGDTEVILAAYRQWGRECLERFRGMFALALWDAARRELWCARDPFGIKPLYFWERGGCWLLASEVRALLAAAGGDARVDRQALGEYLAFGACHAPRTMVEGIGSLEPGEEMVIASDGKLVGRRSRQACRQKIQVAQDDPQSLRRSVRDAFFTAADRHMVSDVPVGLFLSGGIDSSLLAAGLAELGRKPEAFTVAFEGADSAWDESAFARQAAGRWGLKHTEIRLGEAEVLERIGEGLAAMDQPTVDGLNTFIVAGAVRRAGGKVALSGLGNDELFGGYPQLRRVPCLAGLGSVPPALRKCAASLLSWTPPFSKAARLGRLLGRMPLSLLEAYRAVRELWPKPLIARLCAGGVPAENPDPDRSAGGLDAVSALELEYYLPDVLLRDADVFGMAHSLEIRVPFLDADYVHRVRALPAALRFRGAYPKAFLADSVLGEMGPDFLRRPKAGFVLPYPRWLRGPLRAMAAKWLGDREFQESLGLDSGVIRRWSDSFQSEGRPGWARLWALVALLSWARVNGLKG